MNLTELEKLADAVFSPFIDDWERRQSEKLFIAAAHPSTIKKLIALVRLQHEALEGMSYYAQPRKTDPMELIGFECNQRDKKFEVAAKALAAYEEMNRE